MSALRTEADMLRTLKAGTYTLAELYEQAEAAGLADRPGGRQVIQDGQPQFRRRVRTALQDAKRRGRARRAGDRTAAWVIEGTREQPRRALFVWLPADPSRIELVLGRAAEVLRQSDEPIDLIVADPPWALGRDQDGSAYRRVYGRDHERVVPGYVDVDPAEYADFTAEWVAAAGEALRPGGYLAVVTGAQQAARVQVAAEDVAGLTYVNSIPVTRQFGMYTTRRFVHQHHQITLMTRGPLNSKRRVFHRPAEMPRGRKGEIYAVDVWTDIPEERRRGLLRYDNALPEALVSRIVRSTTDEGDLVADPFLGSGTTAVTCMRLRRRFWGCDRNPNSLRFTMGRILAEVLPTLPGSPPLPPAADTDPNLFELLPRDPWGPLLREANR
ncbi:DNA-methyltransferase [Micromonospora sp. NPDC049366]|uniref:DNA-methyltransferase n=1 Tax=Micromonospora sp. NPDC049366 TaxID=3364271 RepID=UPI00378DBC96